ncbi:MAG: PxxKW family cysteine-rich protein [Thermodesulfobacteriota bacterium]|nr:PxxKW family cysteine-rich protein [Thermodesulfobacteriota bacterium]
MICQTVKVGVDCVFMKKKGCSFNGGKCDPIVDSCEGCDRIEEYPSGRFCRSCGSPVSKWSKGKCNFATHIKRENGVKQNKLNPLKASKRNLSS